MAAHQNVYRPISTVGGATITVGTAGTKLGGFFLNGSAGGTTIAINNGATTILSTSAGVGALLVINCNPISFPIVATCSGTGFYTLFIST